MKTRQRISITALAASSALCLIPTLANAQSTYKSDRNGNPIYDGSGRPGENDRINGTLSTRQQRVTAGNSVVFGYTVTNQGRNTRTYKFPSAQMFDMEAIRVDVGANRGRGNGGNGGRRVIWRYSDDQMSAQMLSEFTLRPGQSRSFVGKWQVSNNISAGTYEVSAFLTPQREDRTGLSTTRIIVENDRDSGGSHGGNGGGWNNGNNGNGGNGNGNDRNEVLEVTDLVRSNTSRYLDRRVTVRGIYRSSGSGSGNNTWLLDGSNVTALIVTGSVPRNARINDRVTVSGTLRRNRDGRLTLQAD